MIDDGALKEDFTIELLGVYPLKECLKKEEELAKTSLYPKGLNGNAGKHIEITEEVREKMSKSNRRRVSDGTHPFLGGELVKQRVEEGVHHLLGGEIQRRTNEKRVKEGTHNFLNSDFQRQNNLKRVKEGTHPFLGGDIQRRTSRRRVEEGTHPSQIKIVCPYCMKEVGSSNFARWHGDKCKINNRTLGER